MATLENFSGLTKSQEDLLSKNYPYKQSGLFTLNTKQGEFTFNTRASLQNIPEGAPFQASSWLQFKRDTFLLKEKFRTDKFAHYTAEWTPKNLMDNLKFKGEYKTYEAQDSEVILTGEYSHEKAKTKFVFGGFPYYVKTSVTTGKPEYGIGFDGKFDLDSQRFHAYNLAAWWFRKDEKLVFKMEGKNKEEYELGNIKMSFYEKLDRMEIGCAVSSDWKSKENKIEVGGDWNEDENTVVRGKFNSEGELGLGLTRKLSEYLKLNLVALVDTTSVSATSAEDIKYGIHLDFNH